MPIVINRPEPLLLWVGMDPLASKCHRHCRHHHHHHHHFVDWLHEVDFSQISSFSVGMASSVFRIRRRRNTYLACMLSRINKKTERLYKLWCHDNVKLTRDTEETRGGHLVCLRITVHDWGQDGG